MLTRWLGAQGTSWLITKFLAASRVCDQAGALKCHVPLGSGPVGNLLNAWPVPRFKGADGIGGYRLEEGALSKTGKRQRDFKRRRSVLWSQTSLDVTSKVFSRCD